MSLDLIKSFYYSCYNGNIFGAQCLKPIKGRKMTIRHPCRGYELLSDYESACSFLYFVLFCTLYIQIHISNSSLT